MFTTKHLLGADTGGSKNRGIFGGGAINSSSTYYNTMDYITISTLGNAVDFGDLTSARYGTAATSSGSRGVFGGGQTNASSRSNVIEYITIVTTGNSIDFGDLTVSRAGLGATSDGSRGVFGGGFTSNSSNVIDYITIATTGNATDLGDLTVARHDITATSNGSRGVFGGGQEGFFATGRTNTIDYKTIATTGNATDFGDLTLNLSQLAATSNGPRGVFGGGNNISNSAVNTIAYITIATAGNAIDFGDLTQRRNFVAATSNGSRGVFGGGYQPDVVEAVVNAIDYITISTTGNATDFGDLTVARQALAALSGFTGA
jgi:hypothetical protein